MNDQPSWLAEPRRPSPQWMAASSSPSSSSSSSRVDVEGPRPPPLSVSERQHGASPDTTTRSSRRRHGRHHLRHHQTRHNHHHHHYPPSHDPSPTTTNTNTNTTTNASPSLSSVSPRPMEALVRNLGKQTLWSGEEEGGAASDERQDGTPEHSRMAIDVDSDPDPADARHLLPVPRSVEMMRLRRMHSRREPSRPTRVRHAGRRPHPPPAVRRETMRPSVDHVTEALPTPSHNQPPIEVDPMEDPTFPGLEPDEGFGDGPDNVSWLSDGRILVDSQSDVLGGNGILHFRSSAETALQCSVVVQKHARMRRRRQRKRETASRASSVMPTDDGT